MLRTLVRVRGVLQMSYFFLFFCDTLTPIYVSRCDLWVLIGHEMNCPVGTRNIDDPLPNILCTAIWMYCEAIVTPHWATLLDYVVLSGPFLSA